MKKTLSINGTERRVEVDQSDGHYIVVVDGRHYEICDVSIQDGVVNFFIGNRVYRAVVSKNGLGTQLTLNGRDYVMEEDRAEDERVGVAHAAGDGVIEAPMPGTVTAVHVAVGDSVRGGQSLVVLESMKMQNEITATVGGVVRAVHCKPGDQVSFGQVLAEITPPAT